MFLGCLINSIVIVCVESLTMVSNGSVSLTTHRSGCEVFRVRFQDLLG